MNGIETSPTHPRVSRETRRLLTAALVALITLWVLARVRFPDRPAAANPIPPLLTQLSARPVLGDLADEMARLQGRLAGTLLVAPGLPGPATAALRVGPDTAVAYTGGTTYRVGSEVLASSAATGLSVLRAPASSGRTGPPTPWSMGRASAPIYLAGASPAGEMVALEPVFIGSLQPMTSATWPGTLWQVPASTGAEPGTLLFTSDGEFAGLLVRERGAIALVPGETVLAEAQRLLARRGTGGLDLGVWVQGLTPALAAAAGAETGVIVSRVEGRGPAAQVLAVGDVVQMVNGTAVRRVADWEAVTSALRPDEAAELTVVRAGETRMVSITPNSAAPAPPALGLTLRSVPDLGSEVVHVEPGSSAHAAGLRQGDLITSIGRTTAPTPVQVRRAFTAAADGDALLLGVSRGAAYELIALTK